MCGRFALWSSGEEIARAFGLADTPPVHSSYNVAPGAVVPGLAWSRERAPRFLAPPMLWGFPLPGGREATVNVRSETADRKPLFARAFAERRCVVPANAFFEWDKRTRPHRPWVFAAADGGPIGLAGIYAPLAERIDGVRFGVGLLTTEPNAEVARAHHRMPVVLRPADAQAWTDRALPPEAAKAMCRPAPHGLLTGHPVDRRINRRDVDDADLIAPACD